MKFQNGILACSFILLGMGLFFSHSGVGFSQDRLELTVPSPSMGNLQCKDEKPQQKDWQCDCVCKKLNPDGHCSITHWFCSEKISFVPEFKFPTLMELTTGKTQPTVSKYWASDETAGFLAKKLKAKVVQEPYTDRATFVAVSFDQNGKNVTEMQNFLVFPGGQKINAGELAHPFVAFRKDPLTAENQMRNFLSRAGVRVPRGAIIDTWGREGQVPLRVGDTRDCKLLHRGKSYPGQCYRESDSSGERCFAYLLPHLLPMTRESAQEKSESSESGDLALVPRNLYRIPCEVVSRSVIHGSDTTLVAEQVCPGFFLSGSTLNTSEGSPVRGFLPCADPRYARYLKLGHPHPLDPKFPETPANEANRTLAGQAGSEPQPGPQTVP